MVWPGQSNFLYDQQYHYIKKKAVPRSIGKTGIDSPNGIIQFYKPRTVYHFNQESNGDVRTSPVRDESW